MGAGTQLRIDHGLDPSCGQFSLQVERRKWKVSRVFISIIFRMIRLKTTFTDITADTLYDVLHDPVYRKVRIKDIEAC